MPETLFTLERVEFPAREMINGYVTVERSADIVDCCAGRMSYNFGQDFIDSIVLLLINKSKEFNSFFAHEEMKDPPVKRIFFIPVGREFESHLKYRCFCKEYGIGVFEES